uniref:Uncharacterized protein n=1 Tax=Ditylenchus dipsaci TaxID=166011 RepID=A0A915DYY8_9BILA
MRAQAYKSWQLFGSEARSTVCEKEKSVVGDPSRGRNTQFPLKDDFGCLTLKSPSADSLVSSTSPEKE